jgi:hypothetical protein
VVNICVLARLALVTAVRSHMFMVAKVLLGYGIKV